MSIAVRETLEGMISMVANQAAKNSDEISPLATTPRVRKNVSSTQKRPSHHKLPAGKDLFGARVMLVETPDETCPSDDAETNIDLSYDAPSETFREQLFSEACDSDGAATQCKDNLKELHESEN